MKTRNRIGISTVLTLCLCLAATGIAEDKMTSSTLSGLKWRSIGPALMSGRISDVAIDPVKPNTWYVAAGSGNLWKTENGGTTFSPIFENYGSYSIGCVTLDPSNRHTVWVGTGEAVGGRHVGYGDGVYLSLDGGKSFRNMGLKKTEHIAKILVDPRNSKIVYVASRGPLWTPGGERGLYKTADGGKSWERIFAKGPYTGVTDIVIDPRDSRTLYAATHQRHRTVAALLNGGPESGIWKSIDAGKTWTELERGLPGGDKGKIAIAISPQKPDVLYATIELPEKKGGFYRSEDRGSSWKKQSDFLPGGTGAHYYQELFVDPHRFDVVYNVDVRLARTDDGGKTWTRVNNSWKHVDNHAVGFHPTDPDFLLVGCDGGLYRSYDYAKTYQFFSNLPLTQFYKVDVDYDKPFYHVVGGTQDNNTQHGPTQTRTNAGIRNADWRITIGGDGHDCAIDPKNPNIIYSESQEGYLRRFDRQTGESVDIRPKPARGEEALRFNWDSPILISPHNNKRLYFGSKKLFRSNDRGDSWTAISADLSRNRDRFKLPMMGRVWSIDAMWDLFAMSQYGNITSISESPVKEGVIYVGTDDGLIHVTENGGKDWRKIDKIYGIPKMAFVNDIKADRFDANTVYAVFDYHKYGSFKPYLMKSTDRGRSWESIAGNLPDRHIVWRVEQDHVKQDLLFVGTEFGAFFTIDGGKRWVKLSSGSPNIPFRDLAIQRRENDLVGATFGRGFYVLDDYTPLRHVNEKMLSEKRFALFPVKEALQYIPDRVLGGRRGSRGDSYYSADNPSYGAVFTYYLRDGLKSLRQQRHEKEKKIKGKSGNNPTPGFPRLKQEDREKSPSLIFTITDSKGQVVKRITGSTSAGLHRIAWDLRYFGFSGGGNGPLVVPGTYQVSVHQRVQDEFTQLAEPQAFQVVSIGESTLPRQDRQKTLDFQMRAGKLQRAVMGASGKLKEALSQIGQIHSALEDAKVPDASLYQATRKLEQKLLDIQDQLTGDRRIARASAMAPFPVVRRLQNALSGTLQQTYGPTKTHRSELEIAKKDYAELEGPLRQLFEKELPALKKKLDAAGVPWTSGRAIPRP